MNTGRSPTSGVYRQPRREPCDEYPNIHRHWDSSHGVFAARVLPGQYYVTDRPDEMISTLLGSCIAACIRDPAVRVGGLNHFMLPDGEGDLDGLASRYGVHAMEHLINDILKRGGRRDRLEIKLFGGGRILSGLSDVGEKNILLMVGTGLLLLRQLLLQALYLRGKLLCFMLGGQHTVFFIHGFRCQ